MGNYSLEPLRRPLVWGWLWGLSGLVCSMPRKTLVTATGAGKKDAVRRALSGVHGPFDCPAGLLSKAWSLP